MADRHLGEERDRRHEFREVLAGEIVAGVDAEAAPPRRVRGRPELLQFRGAFLGAELAAEGPGVEFDPVGADRAGERRQTGIGVDEQRHP